MQTQDLISFCAVARLGSISAAAIALGQTQPTLSKAIARLENHTKTHLLERQARGVRLTPYGQAMLEYAQRIDLTITDMMAHLRDLRQAKTGVLRWGIGAGVANDWVLPACQQLHADGVQLEIVGGMTDVLMQELMQGQLDMLLIGTPGGVAAPAKWQKLCDDPMQPVAPKNHPLTLSKRLTMQQLSAASWVLPGPLTFSKQEFDLSFQSAGLTVPTPAASSRSSQRDLALAKTLNALTLLPRSLTHVPEVMKDYQTLPIPSGWRSRRCLGFVWRDNSYRSPLSMRCVRIVQEHIKLI
jgi:LysR family transcriptional regulator, regulator of abg operon